MAELYVQYYTYRQMKRKTRVTKAGAEKAGRTTRRKTIALMASAEEPKNARVIEDFHRMYKARKKAVTLRLDADVLVWFKREGRGYQTRINRALRGVLWEGEGKSWK